MNQKRKTLVAVLAALVLFPLSASAVTHSFSINLTTDQAQQTNGMGSGTGTATYNDKTGSFTWNYTFTVGSTVNSAHFHGPGAPGVHTAPPIVTVPSASASPNMGSVMITPAQGGDLIQGLWYLNVHTSFAPSGEIRGQLVKTGDDSALIASYDKKIKSLNKKIKSLNKKVKAAKRAGNAITAKKYAKALKKLRKSLKRLQALKALV